MAGYLDQYGAGEEKRENIVKFSVLGVLLVLILGTLGYYVFKNHSQEAKVRVFLETLRKKDYPAAYQLWGCAVSSPCPGYGYDRFLNDWGPKGATPDLLRIADSESCNAGVILTVDTNASKQEKLWVENQGGGLAYSPFERCPNKSPLSNMIHQTVGKLRKPFLN
jgi:hypothetical protein